jgi:hypothetical protein
MGLYGALTINISQAFTPNLQRRPKWTMMDRFGTVFAWPKPPHAPRLATLLKRRSLNLK